MVPSEATGKGARGLVVSKEYAKFVDTIVGRKHSGILHGVVQDLQNYCFKPFYMETVNRTSPMQYLLPNELASAASAAPVQKMTIKSGLAASKSLYAAFVEFSDPKKGFVYLPFTGANNSGKSTLMMALRTLAALPLEERGTIRYMLQTLMDKKEQKEYFKDHNEYPGAAITAATYASLELKGVKHLQNCMKSGGQSTTNTQRDRLSESHALLEYTPQELRHYLPTTFETIQELRKQNHHLLKNGVNDTNIENVLNTMLHLVKARGLQDGHVTFADDEDDAWSEDVPWTHRRGIFLDDQSETLMSIKAKGPIGIKGTLQINDSKASIQKSQGTFF